MDQKSTFNLATVRCCMGLLSYLRLGVLFQVLVVVSRVNFLAAVELTACFFKAIRKETLTFF